MRVTSGAVRDHPGRAVVLSRDRAQETFDRYAATHPYAWARLQAVVEIQLTQDRALTDVLPVLDLVLDAASG